MKILVMSDSHGRKNQMLDILSANDDCGTIIFLGDGERDLDALRPAISGMKKVVAVRGNCDSMSLLPATVFENIAGVPFYITHGYEQHVKSGFGKEFLASEALKAGRSIALFGHTHAQYEAEILGVHLFNPGSVANGDYGIIEINDRDNKQQTFRHCTLP